MEDALVLARTSASVTIIHRRGAFRASHTLAQRVLENDKARDARARRSRGPHRCASLLSPSLAAQISVRWNATVAEFVGDETGKRHGGYPTLEGVVLQVGGARARAPAVAPWADDA